jgi:predicted peptidase
MRIASRCRTSVSWVAILAALLAACAGPQRGPLVPGPEAVVIGQHVYELDTLLSRRVTVGYLLHLPDVYGEDPGARWPLILYLHGGSLRGSNPDTVRLGGMPRVVEADPGFPFIAVAPQAPRGALWTDTDALIALLDEVIGRYAVDPARVYLTGHSMGGNGTWYLAYRHPERFAAIAPMSAPANPWWQTRLLDMPVWVFHGARDEVVPLRESKNMVEALREVGNTRVRLTVLPERGHGLLDLYKDRALYDWFLQHRRE